MARLGSNIKKWDIATSDLDPGTVIGIKKLLLEILSSKS